MKRYVVAATHAWNRRVFEEEIARLPGEWRYVDRREDLTPGWLDEFRPRYVFFLHWSWRVPKEITDRYECVCFHMTDVPYGRGGSPLQNLILRGHAETKLSALRMTDEVDAGPVYAKAPLALDGRAQDVYERASRLAAGMVRRIVEEEPAPTPQSGEPVAFRRRSPDESEVPRLGTAREWYDFIRMLDAEGYPRAFLRHGAFRLELEDGRLEEGRVVARVVIRPEEKTP